MSGRSSRAERRLKEKKASKILAVNEARPLKKPPPLKKFERPLQVTDSQDNSISDDFDFFNFSNKLDEVDVEEATKRAELYMRVDNHNTDKHIRISNNRAEQKRKDIELYAKLGATGLAFLLITFFVYLGFSKVTDAGGLMLIPALAVGAVIIMVAARIVGFDNPIDLVRALGGFLPGSNQNNIRSNSNSDNNSSDHST